MYTLSSEIGELEPRGNISKDRTKVDQHSDDIGTSEIISSDDECRIVNKHDCSKCREKSKTSQKIAFRNDKEMFELVQKEGTLLN